MTALSNADAPVPQNPARLRPKPPARPVVVSSIASAEQGAEGDTKQKPELSHKPQGHWRRVYYIEPPAACGTQINPNDPPPIHLGDGVWITSMRHVSEEHADELGRADDEINRRAGSYPLFIRYLRAEYFPEYA